MKFKPSKHGKRRINPSAGAALLTGLVLSVAVVGGVWYFRESDKKKSTKKKADATRQPPSLPRPPSPTEPASEDEPLLIFNEDCSDFTLSSSFWAEDLQSHPDHQRMVQLVQESVDEAKGSTQTLDPFLVAANVLNDLFSPQCEFPPSPDASPRLVQLYLLTALGVTAIAMSSGVTVPGLSGPSAIDAWFSSALKERGYPDFDPSVLPDMMPPSGGQDGPPEMGSVLEHDIDALVPDEVLYSNQDIKIYAQGNLDEDTDIQLVNNDTAEVLDGVVVDYFSPGTMMLTFHSAPPGTYRAFVRSGHNSSTPWRATQATVVVRPQQTSLTMGSTPSINF